MLLILREAFYGVTRYDDIREDLGISRSVLTDRLQKLVAIGVMKRQLYQEHNDRKRLAYVLTARGRELGIVMLALLQWGNRSLPPGRRHDIVERSTGRPVQLEIVNGDGARINSDDIEIGLTSDN